MNAPRPSADTRVEVPGWIAVGVIVAILTSLSLASAANYTSIVIAQEVVYLQPAFRVEFAGLGSPGGLSANGSVSVNVSFTVVNPSDRSLHVWEVTYCGWIEDLPVEAGLNLSRLTTDRELVQNSTTHHYYQVMCPPSTASDAPVPAHGTAILRFVYTTTRGSDPARFAVVQNITEYAAHVLGNASAAAWNHWLQVFLLVDGVPPATSPTAGSYILKIHIIAREVGTNLG